MLANKQNHRDRYEQVPRSAQHFHLMMLADQLRQSNIDRLLQDYQMGQFTNQSCECQHRN